MYLQRRMHEWFIDPEILRGLVKRTITYFDLLLLLLMNEDLRWLKSSELARLCRWPLVGVISLLFDAAIIALSLLLLFIVADVDLVVAVVVVPNVGNYDRSRSPGLRMKLRNDEFAFKRSPEDAQRRHTIETSHDDLQ